MVWLTSVQRAFGRVADRITLRPIARDPIHGALFRLSNPGRSLTERERTFMCARATAHGVIVHVWSRSQLTYRGG